MARRGPGAIARLAAVFALAACVSAGAVARAGDDATSATFEDPWITMKAKVSLITQIGAPALDIAVDTVDGHLTLHGTVESEFQKDKAAELAAKIDGVHSVRNLLQIVEPAEERALEITDAELAEHLKEKLETDPRLAGSEIGVASVNDGAVLLEGEAATLSDHVEALQIAAATDGVREVASTIRSPDRVQDRELWSGAETPSEPEESGPFDDALITTSIKMRLIADDLVPALAVNVDTRAGEVTLFGTVGSEAAKKRAATIAGRVAGQEHVKNMLEVVPPAEQEKVEREDTAIRDAVTAAIDRNERLEDASISVEVANGVVRLTGEVSSAADRLAAATCARRVKGVRAVNADLVVTGE